MIKKNSFYTNCRSWGNYLLYRGIEDGRRINRRIEYSPSVFVPIKKQSKYKTLDGIFVERIQPGGIKDTRDFLERYKDIENFKVYGNTFFHYCYLSDEFPNDIEYNLDDILVAVLDIETSAENGFPEASTATEAVLAITVKLKKHYFTFGCGEFDPTKVEYDVTYKKFSNEHDLLKGFLDFWIKNYPDVVTGWASSTYDIPYLVNRITKVLGEDQARKLSPWEKFTERSVMFMGKLHKTFSLVGIGQLDYIELYKKFAPNNNQESYKLDNISYVELGEKKLEYDGSLTKLYKENFQKFIEYNIRDCYLVDKLDSKLHLIDLVLSIAYSAKINYDDVFKQTRIWDGLIFNDLRKKNIVVPPQKEVEKEDYVGGFVKEPIVGLHKWIVCLDFNGLYPNLIRMFNISPETLCNDIGSSTATIEDLVNKKFDTETWNMNHTMAGNGYYFRSDITGFLPSILEKLYNERGEYKRKMIESKKELERVEEEMKRRGINEA